MDLSWFGGGRSGLIWARDADSWARGQGAHCVSKFLAGWRLRLVTLSRGPEIIFFKLKLLPCNTRFIKEHKPSNHIRARIKSHVYTTE